ncbi:Bor1p [Maudiozyma barnettii]|uniref:Similar to Saccharomyces cerevisiae YNL275W BOR1 Boron efflux transporter of the plasma membrane n=1 Tax=Maudiozyma barnettii TaxID=61262 RepID=A0A8H2VE76_9SACH|nr:Bor1p [Kazachstania barnettii]CAB4253946.1 similar to Saccharomyces cerevisiae YNL275W BOR1 Boron efflux transporter of the plasma membrane [Kazachstania barnettii]
MIHSVTDPAKSATVVSISSKNQTVQPSYDSQDIPQDNDSNSNGSIPCKRRRRIPIPGKGIYLDLKDRLPLYKKDWTDSLDYRVIPAVVETFFNNLLPALAFAQDMFDRTNNAYGVNEVLLSSAMAGIVFGVLSGQPLCIVGVTGPISIFNYTVYDIIKPLDIDYFGFMFWVCIWSMIFHFIIALTNLVGLLQFVTTFPCDIFGLFINIVYIQKGIQILIRQFTIDGKEYISSGFASIVVALLMMIFGVTFKQFTRTPFLNHTLRTFISDYSTALSVLFWSAFTHFGGYLNDIHFAKLPITKSFYPTSKTMRDPSTWLAYHSISTGDVFIALPFGIILTILFYFDHNVSSLMAQRHQYKLTKPSSFHYDFLLLGITTGVSGVLGIPAPNGLIPQAPLHTESLLVRDVDGSVIKCVEQRFTNTVQGLLLLGTMSRPLLICLHQIPQAVLSGLFFIMGIGGLSGNVIVSRIMWLFTDPKKKDPSVPLYTIRTKPLLIFLAFSLAGFVGEFAITNTIAAIGFPLVLLLTVIVSFVFPYIFTKQELEILDPHVAKRFTIKNLLLENLCGDNRHIKSNNLDS